MAKTVMTEAERVIYLREGRVVYEGGVEDLYWNPATEEQAQCLGEANWLDAEDARLWLGEVHQGRSCYRAEQVDIARSDGGPLAVKSSRFMGAVAETELVHQGSGRTRRFYHRAGPERLRPGDCVVLKVLLMVLLLLLVGCDGAKVPSLQVREVHCWQMPSDGTTIPAPRAVAIGSADEVFVVDTAGRIVVFDQSGVPLKQWRMPQVEAGSPEGICVLADGRVAVSDTHYHRVILFDAEGRVIGQFGREGTGAGEFIYPVAVTQDVAGDLYVCEYGSNDRVQKFTVAGEFILSFGGFGTGPGQFQRPSGMVCHEGKVYVADAMNNRVQVFSDAGEFQGVLGAASAGLSFHFPYDIAMGRDGTLYLAEYGAGRVSNVSLDGRLLGRYGSPGRAEGQFQTPWGLAVDSEMRLRIADTGNRRIVELKLPRGRPVP